MSKKLEMLKVVTQQCIHVSTVFFSRKRGFSLRVFKNEKSKQIPEDKNLPRVTAAAAADATC